jgi:hypothetical protein
MRILYTILFTAMICLPASATIINIPGDYDTIQEGIDASTGGDTVLVQQGTYVENVNFNGHNIVLGSLFLTTGDTTHIAETIIDGDSSGSVVTFSNRENSTAMLAGLKITHGLASRGGGIYSQESSPTISNNIITENTAAGNRGRGGGIYCEDSSPLIVDNIICSNKAVEWDFGAGGGIYCYRGEPTIRNNLIVENEAWTMLSEGGGGIACSYANGTIINNTFCNNVMGGVVSINGNNVLVNNIIWGDGLNIEDASTITYSDIWGGWPGEGNIDSNPIYVDMSRGDYNLCSSSPCIDAGDPNIEDPDGTRSDMGVFFPDHPECSRGIRLYVATTGNDESGDGSYENPFRTIQHAVDVSMHEDTVIVENGTYFENVSITAKNIVLASNYLFSNDYTDVATTIINGGSAGRNIVLYYCWGDMVIDGFTIKNGNALHGAGISSSLSDNIIRNNIITQNVSSGIGGGGIYVTRSNSIITGNVISDNFAHYYGGGIILSGGADHVIQNNTFTSNYAEYEGGGLSCLGSHEITNNIFWDNDAPESPEIVVHGGSPSITYCDIQGGWNGEGNINANPLFRDPENGDFHLMADSCGDVYNSPCIDAGDPAIFDSMLSCDWGLGELRSDMGAYGGGDSATVGIIDQEPRIPERFALLQNYPNPFNAKTIIRYNLPSASDVRIEIYDILGRKLQTLVDDRQPAGYHQAIWNAFERSSAIYFYRIQAGKHSETRKMLLIR